MMFEERGGQEKGRGNTGSGKLRLRLTWCGLAVMSSYGYTHPSYLHISFTPDLLFLVER